MSGLPRVLLVGGPDVDARLDLMQRLKEDFDIGATGSLPALREKFVSQGFFYETYHLDRGANPFSDLLTIRELVGIMRRLRPQIVHAFDSKPGIWGCLAARLAGVPVSLCTLTGLGSLYGGRSLKSRITWPVYKNLRKLTCHLSDLTIFQNHDDADYFNLNGIVNREKTEIILGSGVPTEIFRPDIISRQEKARVRQELKIVKEEIVVTMVSRVIRSKGVMEYMAASKIINDQFPKIHFLLVGPEDKDNLDRLTAEEMNQLRETVTYTGARKDIPAILAVSDIFVLPSAYREGIPRVLLEASSMGMPLITTDSPGCNEVVEDGVNGLLIPAAETKVLSEAIIRLIDQPQLRRKFGLASRARAVECFDLSVIAARTKAIYEQLLMKHGAETVPSPYKMTPVTGQRLP